MPERRFDTGYWSEPLIMKLPMKAKLLYLYLWTNLHCNQAGLYGIAIETIGWETGLSVEEIPELLKLLEKKVTWLPEQNLVWVKNFLRRQSKSPKFLVAAIEGIKSMRNNIPEDLKDEFYAYNEGLFAVANIDHEPSLSKRECVIIRDNFKCQYCGKELADDSDYEMDHIIPKVKGGKDHYLNLAASCHACNVRKLNQTPEEAGLTTPDVTTFHAAQAIFLLKNDVSIRAKWVMLFPEKGNNIESILLNIGSRYSSISYSYSLSNPLKEKGVVKGEEKKKISQARREPIVNEIFEEMRVYLGYPDKISQDPIPSYGKEGQSIKRMLTRGFTREAIVACWKGKVSQRGGEFVSMTWVNHDIGQTGKRKSRSKELSSEEEITASIKEAGK